MDVRMEDWYLKPLLKLYMYNKNTFMPAQTFTWGVRRC